MCFGFRFTVVMYRGHIFAEWENISDIADIDGNRMGGQDLFYPRELVENIFHFVNSFRQSLLNHIRD
jgi:hypothetical protein